MSRRLDGGYLRLSTDSNQLPNACNTVQTEYKFKPFVFERVTYGEGICPRARCGHRMVSNSHEVYVYGGYNILGAVPDLELIDEISMQSRPAYRELWKFSMTTRKWTKIPAVNMPSVLTSNAALLLGTMLLIYGGSEIPIEMRTSNSLFFCNLAEDLPEFKEVEVTGNAPEAGYGMAAYIRDEYLYAVGGTTRTKYSNDIHRFHLPTRKWEVIYMNHGLPLSSILRSRREIGLKFDGSRTIIMFGGEATGIQYRFKSIGVYNLTLKKWLTISTTGDPNVAEHFGYPLHRRFHSLVQIPGKQDVYIIGGATRKVLADSWKLNLKTLEWTRIDSLQLETPLYLHGSTLTPQGKLIIFGGKTRYLPTAIMWNAWLCIPKLQEICWEAILFYNLLNRLSEDSVKQLIPPEFLGRL